MKFASPFRAAAVLGLAALLLLPLWRSRPSAPVAGAGDASDQPTPVVLPELAAAPEASVAQPAAAALRPLPVSQSTRLHEWTREDARAPEIMRAIARNADEFSRLVEENDRILRRQLIYRKDVVAAALQRSRLTGEPVTGFVLPGFDGQEFSVRVATSDLAPSRQTGAFTGHLAGQPGSIVTLAFRFGREAFTILSPETGLFLQGHPRESGEIILTSFEPEAYTPRRSGEPILTDEP